MGMFDNIRCEMPLEGSPKVREWQTKCTPDQKLTMYTIRADGTLWWKPYETYVVPKEERPYPNEEGLLGMCGMLGRNESDPEQLSDFHGDLYFYGSDENDDWWEYRARFTEGVCEIRLEEGPDRAASVEDET